MGITGQCAVCLAGSVEHTCNRCGGLVCAEHFDERTGFCVDCVAETRGGDTYRL